MPGNKYILPFFPLPRIRRRPAPFHKELGAPHCVDFAMSEGTPILAARDGVVSTCIGRYGKTYADKKLAFRCNVVEITHEDGEISLYAHLARRSLRVKKGERVAAGQIIALSGQTGYATYPHLHFGVYNAKCANIKIRWAK